MNDREREAAGTAAGGSNGHVSDRLPEHARGELPPGERERVEAHLRLCAACREEADVVSLLAAAPLPQLAGAERVRVYGEVARRRGSSPSGWRGVAWKAAAAIALLLTGFGVWRVAGQGEASATWSPAPALAALERDVEELDLGVEEVRLALGAPEPEEGLAAWPTLGEEPPFDAALPWEAIP